MTTVKIAKAEYDMLQFAANKYALVRRAVRDATTYDGVYTYFIGEDFNQSFKAIAPDAWALIKKEVKDEYNSRKGAKEKRESE